jgi:hypothetical protein
MTSEGRAEELTQPEQSEENASLAVKTNIDPGSGFSNKSLLLWADIFFAILSEPRKTLAILADARAYVADKSAIFGAGLLVVLANMIAGIADGAMANNVPTLMELFGAAISSIMLWLFLAFLLHVVSRWTSETTGKRNCLVTIGWAFLPLIFKAPALCFALPWLHSGWILALPNFWCFVLQMQAFDVILKLGKFKLITLMFLLPPLLIFAYCFWLFTVASSIVGAFF